LPPCPPPPPPMAHDGLDDSPTTGQDKAVARQAGQAVEVVTLSFLLLDVEFDKLTPSQAAAIKAHAQRAIASAVKVPAAHIVVYLAISAIDSAMDVPAGQSVAVTADIFMPPGAVTARTVVDSVSNELGDNMIASVVQSVRDVPDIEAASTGTIGGTAVETSTRKKSFQAAYATGKRKRKRRTVDSELVAWGR